MTGVWCGVAFAPHSSTSQTHLPFVLRRGGRDRSRGHPSTRPGTTSARPRFIDGSTLWGKSPFRGPGPRGPVRQCAREEIIVSKASRALHIVAYVTLSPLTSRRRGPAFFGPSPVYVGAASAGQRYLYDENGYARSGATRASTLTRERQTNSVLPRKLQLTI